MSLEQGVIAREPHKNHIEFNIIGEMNVYVRIHVIKL